MISGEYEVVGKAEYLGHPQGTVFVARLNAGAERRAVNRGAIRLIRRVEPTLEPGSYQLPTGWLTATTQPGG